MANKCGDGITTTLKYLMDETASSQTEPRDVLDVGTSKEGYAWVHTTALTGTLTVEMVTSARNSGTGDYVTTGTALQITQDGAKSVYLTQLGRYVGVRWTVGTSAEFEVLYVRKA